MAALTFKTDHTDINTKARAGKIQYRPWRNLYAYFHAGGYSGSVKAVTQQQLKEDVKAQIILGNTYHLYPEAWIRNTGSSWRIT